MKVLAIAALALLATTSLASAQKSIHTGGQNGAYFRDFCPPLVPALQGANFPNYKCAVSGGTVDNIAKVVAKPDDIAFVQLDVLAREMAAKPELAKALSIIRQDIACEGLWMVTKNQSIKSFGDLLGSRRTPYVVPAAGSGSASSFAYLQSIDPEGLGRAKNIRNVGDTTAVINAIIASQNNEVGFFVQFADPSNANIRLMMENKLNVIPVVSREVTQAKVGGADLYSVQQFNLTSGGLFVSGEEKISACTPVAVITGNPDNAKDRDAKDDQKDLIKVVASIPSDKLLPADDKLAKLLKSAKKLGTGALNEMLAAAEKAKKAAESMGN